MTEVASNQLLSIIERVENLEEGKRSISDDIKEVYAEAKGNGFSIKAIRQIVKLRRIERAERLEQEAILETYLRAIGEI
jgi:uncharacterized protein (UPF0335 family)